MPDNRDFDCAQQASARNAGPVAPFHLSDAFSDILTHETPKIATMATLKHSARLTQANRPALATKR
jgi:hypothetical protein